MTRQRVFQVALLLSMSMAAAAWAQVSPRSDAYFWRGFAVNWGDLSHRIGYLDSYIAPTDYNDYTIKVKERIHAGCMQDPGGVKMETFYTHYVPTADSGDVRFWHLAGDSMTITGTWDCTESADTTPGATTSTISIGGDPSGGGFDASSYDPHDASPGDFDHLLLVLNGIRVDPIEPSDAHTVDYIHIWLQDDATFDSTSQTVESEIRVIYRPGCIPSPPHACANPLESPPPGTTSWEVKVQAYYLLVGWNDGHGERLSGSGRIVDPSSSKPCGDDSDIAMYEQTWFEAPPASSGLENAPVIGFKNVKIYAGAPGSDYESGAPLLSCAHCAVALSGRHIRDFELNFDRDASTTGWFVAKTNARWSNHPWDGNPFSVPPFQAGNPHWPYWRFAYTGLFVVAGNHFDLVLSDQVQPASSLSETTYHL